MSDSSTVVLFEGGLDMVTPVQNTSPGTLINCLNYEVGPIKGYKRIDGYESFDGGVDGGISNLYYLRMRPGNPSITIGVGASILLDGQRLAVVVDVGPDDGYYVVPTTPGLRIYQGDDQYRVRTPEFLDTFLIVLSNLVDTRELTDDYEEYIARMYAAQSMLRSGIAQAPNTIAGIYHGRETAYAVVDSPVLFLSVEGDVPLGRYVRYNGVAYRVTAKEGALIWLSQLPIAQIDNAGLELITYNQYVLGQGNTGTVTSFVPQDSGSDNLYAQPFVLSNGYHPIPPAVAVAYEDGEAAPTGTVKISDGTLTTTHNVLGYSVTSGSFSNGDATGMIYLTSGTASTGFTGVYDDTLTVLDEDDATVANVTQVIYPSWAGSAKLRDVSGLGQRFLYQWGTYNFKGTDGYTAVYCTNGVGRAGWIDERAGFAGASYGSIVTDPDNHEVDIPKYLAFHAEQRLLLAFANGSVQLSAVGQPLNFSGLDGAVEVGNGDNVTGALEAAGDSTIIFGPRTIRRLVGKGTGLTLQTISSESGAMDYSCVVVAGVPVYVNHNGICALDQTSAYGDFKNSSISGAIDPFFTPRIVQEVSSAEFGGIICAYPVRAKNQYRLFLADGNVINMSLTPDGSQLMKGSYESAGGGARIPLAYSSSVDDRGHEYILTVWDAAAPDARADAPNMRMAYRMDHGWGFDGETFDHHIETAYMFNEQPTFLSIVKAILYGMGYGSSTLRLDASAVDDSFTDGFTQRLQDISMPRNQEVLYKQLTRVLGIVDHANWGRALTLRFGNVIEAGQPTTEPPHILQSVRLFVQTEGIKE